MPARLSGVDEVGLSGVDEVGLSGVADVDRRRKYCPLEGVPLVKIGLTQESIRGKSGHQTHLPGVDKGPEVIMRPAAFERVGRCSAHPVSPMHACQHLKSGKVKKHVKRHPFGTSLKDFWTLLGRFSPIGPFLHTVYSGAYLPPRYLKRKAPCTNADLVKRVRRFIHQTNRSGCDRWTNHRPRQAHRGELLDTPSKV